MEPIKTIISKIVELMGFSDYSINLDEETRRLTIFINEGEWLKGWLPKLTGDFSQIARALSRKFNAPNIFVDVNNYRKEREIIISELAKAAARKAVMTKTKVTLPAINAYERRLVHVELAARPDIATESEGEGVERRVTVKLLG